MKFKTVMMGSVVLALTMVCGTAAYAASADSVFFRHSISQNEDSAISFEAGSNLPDDVQYREQIDFETEGELPLNGNVPAELPEGVLWQDSVSAHMDGSMSFENGDNSTLPEGVSYTNEVSEKVSGDNVFRFDN